MANNEDALSATSLSQIMATSLPQSATPQIKTAYDTIALAVYACMVATGCRFVGIEEDENSETDTQSSSSQSSRLPVKWNYYSTITFRFVHSQSGRQFSVKFSRSPAFATVEATTLDHEKSASFVLKVQDFITSSNFPSNPVSTDDASSDTASEAKAIQDLFISEQSLADLGSLVKAHIINKLLPDLRKEDQAEASSSRIHEQARDHPQPSRAPPANNPYNIPELLRDPGHPRPQRVPAPGEVPPGFEDEYDILRAPGRDGRTGAPPPFGNMGHDDLYPAGLGPRDPLSGGPGGIGRQPQGMHPTPDEILAQRGGFGSGGLGVGDDGFASGRVPPGARYDPTHPGDPFDPMRGPGGRGGGSGPGGFGGGFGGPGSGGGFAGGSGFPGGGFL